MRPISSTQQRLQAFDFNFPTDQLHRKSTRSSSLASNTFERKGELGFKQSNSDHPSSIEAKLLNGCGVEIRRHSFPGLLPPPHEILPLSKQNGLSRDRRDRASLDSNDSKSVAKYLNSTNSQSLFLKSPPAPWLGVNSKSQLSSSQDQTDSSNPSSPDSDSSGGTSVTAKPDTLSSVKSMAVSNSRVRYSPMFLPHDTFSSPFTSPTIFDKPTASNQLKVKEPKQFWTSNPGQYGPEPKPVASLPVLSMTPGLDSQRVGLTETPSLSTPESVLRSVPFEEREPSAGAIVSSSFPTITPESHGLVHTDLNEGVPIKSLSDHHSRLLTSEPLQGPRSTDFEGATALPNISGLSLVDGPYPKKAGSPPIGPKTRNLPRPDQDIQPKPPVKRERYEGDSDVETDPSETDSESGDIRERELSGIESEIDSEEDPSRSRSFWQAKRAGNQGGNSATVSVLELYKTEICLNWLRTRNCSYGNKCHYAHGMADLRTRQRIETYKTQPCADPARNGCHVCMYTSRCNYAHPGEPIRRMGPLPGKKYFDPEYFEALRRDYPYHEMPFGVFV